MTNRPAVRRVVACAAALTLAGALVACAADDGSGRGAMRPPGGAPMAQSMRSEATSEADYLATMVSHHLEAIASAQELARSERPRMRFLGRSIVETQTREVELMRDWLARYHPGQPEADDAPMMRDLTSLLGGRPRPGRPGRHDRPPHGGGDDVAATPSRPGSCATPRSPTSRAASSGPSGWRSP